MGWIQWLDCTAGDCSMRNLLTGTIHQMTNNQPDYLMAGHFILFHFDWASISQLLLVTIDVGLKLGTCCPC